MPRCERHPITRQWTVFFRAIWWQKLVFVGLLDCQWWIIISDRHSNRAWFMNFTISACTQHNSRQFTSWCISYICLCLLFHSALLLFGIFGNLLVLTAFLRAMHYVLLSIIFSHSDFSSFCPFWRRAFLLQVLQHLQAHSCGSEIYYADHCFKVNFHQTSAFLTAFLLCFIQLNVLRSTCGSL